MTMPVVEIDWWRDLLYKEVNRRRRKVPGEKYTYRFLSGGHFFFLWWDCLQQAYCDTQFGKPPGSTYEAIFRESQEPHAT